MNKPSVKLLLCALTLLAVASAKGEEKLSLLDSGLTSTTISGYSSWMELSRLPEEDVARTYDPQLADLLANIRDEIYTQDDSYTRVYERPVLDFEKPRSAKEIQVVPEPSALAFLSFAALTSAVAGRRKKHQRG
jgi:hypothetical protein